MKTNRPSTRVGFTMIELLIVITLMAVLMSILVSLVQGITGSSRQAATRSSIIKISRMMENRTRAFHRSMDKLDQRAGRERPPEYVKRVSLFRNLFRNKREALALVLARKHEFRRHFPQMFSEVNTSPTGNNWPYKNPDGTDTEFRTKNFYNTKHLPETESAECLYYFLTQGETFGAEPIDPDAFTSREVADTDGDGLLEFVDSWERPLRFYRWPTRLFRPGPPMPSNQVQKIVDDALKPELKREFAFRINEAAASVLLGPLSPRPQFPPNSNLASRLPLKTNDLNPTVGTELEDPLSHDGDDPLGLTFRWFNPSNNFTPFVNNWLAPENFEKRFHTPSTYHVPLIVSAGPDGEIGLYEPHDVDYNASFFIYGKKNDNFDNKNYGRLAQPIFSSSTSDGVDPRLYDDISNIFLRAGVAR